MDNKKVIASKLFNNLKKDSNKENKVDLTFIAKKLSSKKFKKVKK